MADKIMLVDGNSLINRGFYAMPLLTNKDGEYTNGVFGFLNIFFRLFDEIQPEYCAVCFDVHQPTFRHKMFGEYKGTRKGMPEELRPQMPLLKKVLQAMNITTCELGGYEADDLLGTLATRADALDLLLLSLVEIEIYYRLHLIQLLLKFLKLRVALQLLKATIQLM